MARRGFWPRKAVASQGLNEIKMKRKESGACIECLSSLGYCEISYCFVMLVSSLACFLVYCGFLGFEHLLWYMYLLVKLVEFLPRRVGSLSFCI